MRLWHHFISPFSNVPHSYWVNGYRFVWKYSIYSPSILGILSAEFTRDCWHHSLLLFVYIRVVICSNKWKIIVTGSISWDQDLAFLGIKIWIPFGYVSSLEALEGPFKISVWLARNVKPVDPNYASG